MTTTVRYYSLLESSGYGLAALEYIQALLDVGIGVYWTPVVMTSRGYRPWPRADAPRRTVSRLLEECLGDSGAAARLQACLKARPDYSAAILHLVPEYWPQLIEPGIRNIGYFAWETSRLPAHMPPLLNTADTVMVPARFNVDALRNSGVNRAIEVVPHILGRQPQPGQAALHRMRERLQPAPADFVFYTINEWSARKAIWRLVEAYLDSFTAEDSVLLVIKTCPSGPRSEDDNERHATRELLGEIVARYANPARIELIAEKIDAEQISALHALGHCYASTCHAEGWGLGAFEAAGCGNPVLITGWGGQLDYLPAGQAALIPCREVPVVDGLGARSYSMDQTWAEPDPGATRRLLLDIYRHPDKYRAGAAELAQTLRRRYSSATIGAQLRTIIDG